MVSPPRQRIIGYKLTVKSLHNFYKSDHLKALNNLLKTLQNFSEFTDKFNNTPKKKDYDTQ